VRNLLAQAGQERNGPRSIGRPLAEAIQVVRLEDVAENIGLFGPPCTKDVVYVQPGVGTEKFQSKGRGVM